MVDQKERIKRIFSDLRGWGSISEYNTGMFIRKFMLDAGRPVYPYEIWRALTLEKKYKGGLEPGRYVSFIANYIIPLKKHGYIVEYGYGDQPLKSNGEGYIPRSKRKKFYIINKSKINDPLWSNVQKLKVM